MLGVNTIRLVRNPLGCILGGENGSIKPSKGKEASHDRTKSRSGLHSRHAAPDAAGDRKGCVHGGAGAGPDVRSYGQSIIILCQMSTKYPKEGVKCVVSKCCRRSGNGWMRHLMQMSSRFIGWCCLNLAKAERR